MNDKNVPSDSISIRFLSGPLAGQTFPIPSTSVTIGREGINDIIIPEPKVSRTPVK